MKDETRNQEMDSVANQVKELVIGLVKSKGAYPQPVLARLYRTKRGMGREACVAGRKIELTPSNEDMMFSSEEYKEAAPLTRGLLEALAKQIKTRKTHWLRYSNGVADIVCSQVCGFSHN